MKFAKLFWIGGGSIVAVGMLIAGMLQTIGVIAHEEYTETAVYPANDIAWVDVSTDEGSVRVVGTDRTDIRVVSRIDEGLRKPSRSVSVEDTRLKLSGQCRELLNTFCSVSYEIEVPRAMAIDADGMNGRLDVRHVDGDVKLTTQNGSIRIQDLKGRLDLDTSNGSITGTELGSTDVKAETSNGGLDLTFLNAIDSVQAFTSNGRIDITLPNTADEYDVEMTTSHGSKDSQVRTDPTSPRRITAKTDNGGIDVVYSTP